ncbi:MAG: gliding motility-associated C-terminal domain-containing protein [Cytophagaceae bacterium]|nr:gliding motility-associated C-terminal domain-containing protein [Cytophagaceae bacterium]MDW8457022.1 gliding motility-associated C-terminal domain-containing protein [Cytophagaceae bacterium]
MKAQNYNYDTLSFNPARLKNIFRENDAECTSVAVQNDGKLLLAIDDTTRNFCIVRLLPNGNLDPSFGMGGIVYINFDGTASFTIAKANIIKVLPEGGILIAGEVHETWPNQDYYFGVAKLSFNGTPDVNFLGTGKMLVNLGLVPTENEEPMDMIIDGNLIYVAGKVGGNMGVCCLNAINGSLHSSFDGDGIRIISPTDFSGSSPAVCKSLLLLNDILYLIGECNLGSGYNKKIAVAALYKTDGTSYTSFASNGYFFGSTLGTYDNFTVSDAKLDTKGRIAITGFRGSPYNTKNFVYYLKTTGIVEDSSIITLTNRFRNLSKSILPDYYGAVVFTDSLLYRVEGLKWFPKLQLPSQPPRFVPKNSFVHQNRLYCYGYCMSSFIRVPVVYRFTILKQPDVVLKGPDVVTELSTHRYSIENVRGYFTISWTVSGLTGIQIRNTFSNVVEIGFPKDIVGNITLTCNLDSASVRVATINKKIKILPLRIVGPTKVYTGSVQMYSTNVNDPYPENYQYSWSYSGTGTLLQEEDISNPLLYFSDVASSGTLTLTITHVSLLESKTLFLNIAVSDYNPVPRSILGKQNVGERRIEFYSIMPKDEGLFYLWKYQPYAKNFTDTVNIAINKGKEISVYFPHNAPSGRLKCYIFKSELSLDPEMVELLSSSIDLSPIDSVFLPIKVIKSRDDLSALLEVPVCEAEPTSCEDVFLNDVEIISKKVKKMNSGCMPGGYSDFVGIELTDTLYLGEVYKIKLKAGGRKSTNAYYGIWLDYDNDGNFNQPHEMLAFSTLPDSMHVTDYIVLKNKNEYSGNVARLRVRVQADSVFDASEFCPKLNTLSETEDFMVVLLQRENLDVPNFITPNNDGKNDLFVIRGIDPEFNNELKVYNRLGNLVFSAANYENNWSGTDMKGQVLEAGTYYFIFTNGKSSKKGFFEVRR